MQDTLSNLVLWSDYLVYLLLNPFKCKSYPKEIKKILLVELFKIGDLLVATPVIEALKRAYPHADLDVLVLPATATILENNPHVNKIIPYTTFAETKARLKQNNYDLGIMLHPGSWKISFLLFVAKVRYRVGCAKSGITYGKGYFLNNKIKPNTQWQHKIEDNLDVIRSLPQLQNSINAIEPRPRLYLPVETETKMRKVLLGKKRPVIVMHPGSSHKTQRWYPEKFAAVADYVQERCNATVVFTGADADREQVQQIIELMNTKRHMNLVGKTNFWEFASLIKNADLVLAIDTSAIHIASAFNVPTVALFGPTMPQFWGPSTKKSKVIQHDNVCTGCRRYECIIKTHECMKTIAPEEVITAIKELMQ